ncbi:transcription factor Adf-1-like [Harmonia axyridis]|uniref:transcription factor Adf-1-like n=1 Tax=Harmonia axyridis TaxID=115357 RepID=UPI001E2785E3|nr:transcription factor Adf-1-like [Harmonia axyridis]
MPFISICSESEPAIRTPRIEMQKIIELVRKHPILYDLSHEDYKNIRKKDKIWDEIGKEICEDGEAVKKKWRNLRDSYAKYIRGHKITTGQATNLKKKWIWADQMEGFRPFLSFTKTSSNVSEILSEESNTGILEIAEPDNVRQHSIEQKYKIFESSSSSTPSISQTNPKVAPTNDTSSCKKGIKKRKFEPSTSVQEMIAYFEGKRKKEHDAIDAVFLGHASTVRTFSPKRQIEVKMRIAQVIMEFEFLNLEESASKISDPTIENMKVEVEDIELQEPHTEFVQALSDSSLKVEDVETRSSDFLQNDNSSECELFGKYVAEELRVLPYLERLDLQQKITECFKKVI